MYEKVVAEGLVEPLKNESTNPTGHLMDQFLIREAAQTDVDEILRLYQNWEEETITHGFISPDENEIGNALGPYFLIAEMNGNIAGFISGKICTSEGLAVVPKGETYLEIVDLYVTPEHRHKKIGSGLIDHLLALAKNDGIQRVLVYSASKDVRNILKFYESHGFQSWYVQMFREL